MGLLWSQQEIFTAVSVLLLYSKFAMSCHAMSRRPWSLLSFLITCSEEATCGCLRQLTCAREDCQGCSPPHVPMGVHAMFLLCLPANEGSSGPFLSVLGGSPSYPSPHTLCGYRSVEFSFGCSSAISGSFLQLCFMFCPETKTLSICTLSTQSFLLLF